MPLRSTKALVTAALLASEGRALAQSFPDPRAFGFPSGPVGLTAGVVVGILGVAAVTWVAAVRRHHARRWVRPWSIALAAAAPLLVVGVPLLAGAVASRHVSGDHAADLATVAATRFIALAAAAGWLIYELLAGVRQHEHDLYAEQRPQDGAARTMRGAAGLLALVLLVALAFGMSVTIVPRL